MQVPATWRYYLFHASTSHGFVVPFAVVYVHQQGYGLDLIGVTQAAFLFAIVAMEMPAGYVADRIGRRASLGVGNVLTAVVMVGYIVVDSAAGWVGIYVLWGVAWSFHSAIGDAWLYDHLDGDDDGDSSAFASTSGRAGAVELVVSAGAAVTAGVLYAVAPALPFLANAALAVGGVPLVASLPAARGGSDDAVTVRGVVRVLRLQLRRPEVRWLILYAALFNVLFSATRWLEQPSLESVGFPLAGFGVLYATFKLVSTGAMLSTGRIQERLGPRPFFLALLPVCGLAYGLVELVPVFVVPVIYLRRVLDRVSGPIRNQYLNDRLDGTGRATVLSGASMALSLASGASNAALGGLAEALGPTTFLPALGVGVVVAAALVWVLASPVRPEPDAGQAKEQGMSAPDPPSAVRSD